jgi:CBS domain-containing protein
MVSTVRDLMTPDPVTLPASTALSDAARYMRDNKIGDVIVTDHGKVCGVVTDRDIVVRAVASGLNPDSTELANVCSRTVISLSPSDSTDEAVRLMREHAIRRVPIIEDGIAVGIISLGDLALERDPGSALADISGEVGNP